MSTRVAYSTNNGVGLEISDFVNEAEVTLAKGRRLKAKLDSMQNGTPADWTSLENEIGGMVPGTGQTLWTIIATAMGQIDSPAVGELARLDKQG